MPDKSKHIMIILKCETKGRKSISYRRGKGKMLWIAVSADKLELPLAVEVTASKLAKKMGTSSNNIKKKKCIGDSGKHCGYKVVTVKGD